MASAALPLDVVKAFDRIVYSHCLRKTNIFTQGQTGDIGWRQKIKSHARNQEVFFCFY